MDAEDLLKLSGPREENEEGEKMIMNKGSDNIICFDVPGGGESR